MRGKWRLPLLRLLLLLIGAGVLEVLCAADIIDRLTMQPPHQIFLDLVHIGCRECSITRFRTRYRTS